MKRTGLKLAIVTLIAVMPLGACSSSEPTALFLGDSYTAGVELPAQDLHERWPTRVSESLGWLELNEGCAGAGYTNAGQVCMTTYRQSIDALIDADPDIIVVSGGMNDLDAPLGEIEAAAHATFVTLQTTFPKARVYAVGGVYAANDENSAALEQIDTIIATQAQNAGATFIDIGEPLADRPDLLTADGIHPNIAGHAVIAELTSNVISANE